MGENIPGDQTTTTSIGKADELDTGNSSPCNDVNGGISTGRTSSTITMCEQGHPQHRSSLSNSSVSSIKSSHLVVIGGTPPPPYDAVASDIDKEEKAIKAGIHRSELFYDPVSVTGDSKNCHDLTAFESKNPSKKIQTERTKYHREGKLAVDDNFVPTGSNKFAINDGTGSSMSRRLLGKSLEDITSPAKKTVKSTSFCQLPSSSITSASSPTAIHHSTIARLNEKPTVDISDLGFRSSHKGKENNNYEVAC